MNTQRTGRAGKVVQILMWGGALGFALAAGGYTLHTLGFWPRWPANGAPPSRNGPEPAGDGTVKKALGRLEPKGGVINVGVPLPDRLQELKEGIAPGKRVQKGEELAVLESHADRLAELELATIRLQEATERYQADQASGEAQIQEADDRLDQLKKQAPHDLRAQQAKVRLLKENLDRAEKDLARIRALQTNPVSAQQREGQELLVKQAREELEGAQALLEKITLAQEYEQRSAAARRRSLEAGLKSSLAAIPLKSLEKSRDLAAANLERTTVRAPSAGEILKVLARPGELVGAQPLLQMADTERMVAIAEVYETDLGQVRPGQRARVTSKALPRPLEGTVAYIGTVIGPNNILDVDPKAPVDRRVAEVQIDLKPDDSKVAARFLNLKVEVTISVDGP
jgi:HlyD family secretion protein